MAQQPPVAPPDDQPGTPPLRTLADVLADWRAPGQSNNQPLRTLADVLAVLRTARVAQLGWLYYESAGQPARDLAWMEDVEGNQLIGDEFLHIPRCAEMFEALWKLTELLGATLGAGFRFYDYGEYVVDVPAGELRRVATAYEVREVRTEPLPKLDQWVLRETDTPAPDADAGTRLKPRCPSDLPPL